MARMKYRNFVTDAAGNTVSGAEVEVRDAAGTLATLYAASSGGTTLANPLTAGDGDPDSVGAFEFWIDEADYGSFSITVGSGASAETFNVVIGKLEPPATLDTMADVASYDRADGVNFLTLRGGNAAYDGLGGQWTYDPSDTTSTHNPPSVLVGADGARYKLALDAIRCKGRTLKPTLGVLERTVSNWQLLTTSAHSAFGLGAVSVNVSGNLEVGFTDTDINSVMSFLAVPDAALSRYGVVMGSSVGVSDAEIYASMPLRFFLGTDGTTVNAHSFWGSKISASMSGSTLTVTHPQISQASSNKVVALPYNDDGTVRVKSTAGGTSTILRLYKKLVAELTYDGTNWSSDNAEVTVDSWSGGTLTLLHAYGAKRIARTQDYTTNARSHISLLSTTRAYIKFYDFAGTQITSPASGYKFMFERDEVDCIFSGALAVSIPELFFDFGYTALDFDDIDNTAGNVWISGFQEEV